MKNKPPNIMVRWDGQRFSPETPYDAEKLAETGNQLFELKTRARRSDPHNQFYWAVLGKIVKATDGWPTAEHLHDDLKWTCGYRRKIVDMETGEVSEVLDSTAYNKMTQAEFKDYTDRAFAKLSEYLGADPIEVAA